MPAKYPAPLLPGGHCLPPHCDPHQRSPCGAITLGMGLCPQHLPHDPHDQPLTLPFSQGGRAQGLGLGLLFSEVGLVLKQEAVDLGRLTVERSLARIPIPSPPAKK